MIMTISISEYIFRVLMSDQSGREKSVTSVRRRIKIIYYKQSCWFVHYEQYLQNCQFIFIRGDRFQYIITHRVK